MCPSQKDRGQGVSHKKDFFVIARSPSLERTTKQSLGWVKEMAIRLLRFARNDTGFRLGDSGGWKVLLNALSYIKRCVVVVFLI
jgi:hypothetical protein